MIVPIQEEEEYLLYCEHCCHSIRGDNKKESFLDTITNVDKEKRVVTGICYICQQAEQAAQAALEHCVCCGSGAKTLSPCPACGELLCQDCANGVHTCDAAYCGGFV